MYERSDFPIEIQEAFALVILYKLKSVSEPCSVTCVPLCVSTVACLMNHILERRRH
jgi:hypothetical protein